jgi:hypothetical protein
VSLDIGRHNEVLRLAGDIGKLLEEGYPTVWVGERITDRVAEGEGCPMIPGEHYKDVAEMVTAVVAEIIQAWLDAGSEREVTLEELGPEIEEHIKGWSTAYDPEGMTKEGREKG